MVHIITKNEIKLLSYLFRHYKEKFSINELGKRIKITPKGVYKILKKFENDHLVVNEKIANALIYKLNFTHQKTEDIVKYALKSESAPNTYIKVLQKDLMGLKGCAKLGIIFGSTLTKGTKAKDIDFLVVIEKNKLLELHEEVRDFETVSPKRIHLVIQTKEDLNKNLHKNDPVIRDILHKGFILWGYDLLYGVIKDDAG